MHSKAGYYGGLSRLQSTPAPEWGLRRAALPAMAPPPRRRRGSSGGLSPRRQLGDVGRGGGGGRRARGRGGWGRESGQMVRWYCAAPAPTRPDPLRGSAAGFGGDAATLAVKEKRTMPRPTRPDPAGRPPLVMTAAARR